MPTQAPTLPKLPFTYAQWKKDTSLTFSTPTFTVLDKAVEAYTTSATQVTFVTLKNALHDWIDEKDKAGGAGAWKKSDRNKKLAVTALFNALSGAGDTDKGLRIPDFMSEGMVNAREGILYLFGNLACDEGKYRIITNGLIDMSGKGAGTIGKAAKRTTDAAACFTPRPKGSPERVALRDRVSVALKGVAGSVTEAVFTQLANGEDDGEGSKTEAIWKAIPGGLQVVCDHIAEHVMDQMSPFLANGVAATQGLVTAIKAGGQRYKVHACGKGVALVPGVPTTTIDGIKRAMDRALAADVFNVLRSGGALALEGCTAGLAGSIVDIAFSAIEMLVAFAKKVHDFYRMRLFLNDAKAMWLQRDKPSSLHRQPYAFNRWYRKTALRVPVIPVLTLHSGICGDKMRMLCMFANDGEVITQQNFDKGVAYIDKIKAWGAEYLAGCAYEFKSADKLVAELIKPARA